MRFGLLIIFIHFHNALGQPAGNEKTIKKTSEPSSSGFVAGSSESCIHGGRRYKTGDYFPPNGTIIKTSHPQECVQCRCYEGLVICEIEKCSVPRCDAPVLEPQFCCRKCPEGTDPLDASSDISIQAATEQTTGCTSNGKHYAEGSVWQPVVEPLGVMSCVQCECEGGTIVCKRYRCKELPCSHPRKEFGRCCRVCPDPGSDGEASSMTECLPKSSEVFVFKTPGTGDNLEKIEYDFLDGALRDKHVSSHVWNTVNVVRGTDSLNVRAIPRGDFLRRNLRLLGATSYRRYRKYLKREERLRLKCLVHCSRKVLRLEKSLRIYPVQLRLQCNEDEVDVEHLRHSFQGK